MARRSFAPLLLVFGLTLLAGCSNLRRAERPAWRTHAENACFAERRVQFSAYVQPAAHELNGPSICGLTRPLKVTALQGGAVLFNSTQTLDCSMVGELDSWLVDVVQPAAMARFGQPVAQIDSMGSYSCRGMNNQFGARLSEHSFGNALDVGGFQLADGRRITLVHDWTRGDEQTQAFLRDVHGGACGHFTTVLSPGSNPFHYNHIHIDLAMHGMTSTGPRRICKPIPQLTAPPTRKDDLPDAPEIDDDIDIAKAAPPADSGTYAMHRGPDLAAAPAPILARPAANPAFAGNPAVAGKPAFVADRTMQGRAIPAPAPRPIDGRAIDTRPLDPRPLDPRPLARLPIDQRPIDPRAAAALRNARGVDPAPRDSGSRGSGPVALHSPPTPPPLARGYAPEPERGHIRDDGAFEPDATADLEPTSRIRR
jgi:hypothetical protein